MFSSYQKYQQFQAAITGDLPALRNFVESGSMVPNGLDEQGKTALHYAAMHGQVLIAQYLVSMGWAVDCPSGSCHMTALHCAIESENSVAEREAMVDCLLALHANPNAATDTDRRPLYAAACKGDSVRIIAHLIDAGANLAYRRVDIAYPETAFEAAHRCEANMAVVAYLGPRVPTLRHVG